MKRLSIQDILRRLQENPEELREIIPNLHPADIATYIDHLPDGQQVFSFAQLPNDLASEVLAEVNEDTRDNLLSQLNEQHLANIVSEMDTDEAADIISELEDDVSENVLSKMDREDSDAIKDLLQYEEDTAGGLMQTEVISIRAGLTRDEVLDSIRKDYQDIGHFSYVFVTDEEERLIGVLDLSELILAPNDKTAGDLMETDVFSATVDMDQEQVAAIFRRYDLFTLPVVDEENRLLGRITVDDIIDVIDEEASEDVYKMVGLENEDRVFTSPQQSVIKRLPWLTLNLFTALLVSSVVGVFEDTIQKLSFLAVLMPIVAGLGGNSGTQTLTVIIRGLALGELTPQNTWRAVMKEISVGLMNGLIVGTFAMLVMWLLRHNVMLGAVLGMAMVCNMFIAGLVGCLVPLFMKFLRFDPALASSVMITMLTDMGGFASFLGLASLLM